MAKVQATTGSIAKGIAEQITRNIGATWSDNPAQWWSNIFNNEQTINSFFSELVNVIIKQRVISESFDNPLNQYKTGDLPLGLGESEIYFNPQTGRDFFTKVDNESTAISSWTDDTANRNKNYGIMYDVLPDIKQVMYRLNYGRQYKRTYSDIELQNVMTSWDSFGSFIDAVSRDLDASANIEEFNAMRTLFTNGYSNGFLPIQPITAVTNKATAEALLVKAREFFTSFQFPSTQFSGWNAKNPEALIQTWTKKDRISIIMTANTAAVVDVYALAAAFNMDKANFIGKIQIVDKLDDNGKVAAIMFDDTLMHVTPKVNMMGAFFNPDTIKQSIYLTRTAIMALCPFANSVVFSTDTFTALVEEPANWATTYTNYYIKVGTTYTKLGEYSEAPTFAANKYYSKS